MTHLLRYFAVGSENLNVEPGEEARNHTGDVKEGYDMGRPPRGIQPGDSMEKVEAAGAADPDLLKPLFGMNQWPGEEAEEELGLKGFRLFMTTYFGQLQDLARSMMRLFALSLGLPADHFVALTERPSATLRILHYPPQFLSAKNKLGCGAHTDYGCCTILAQDATGGLQLRNSHGQWVHAPPMEGTFVINLGDMMNRWTNKLYRSTVRQRLHACTRIHAYTHTYNCAHNIPQHAHTHIHSLRLPDVLTCGCATVCVCVCV